MNPTNFKSELLENVGAIAALATSALLPEQIGEHHSVMVPAGYTHQDISASVEKTQLAPNRKAGAVTVKDLPSLLAYAADQCMSESGYIYADPDTLTITAVFNDQRLATLPGWRDHRAVFKLQTTPEFARWMDNNGSGKAKSQTDFAEFLEDNMADITEPGATSLIAVAQTMQAKTEINFSRAHRLDNGQVQLQYTESTNATAGASGSIQIPRDFGLGLRLFKNGDAYKLRARLKYRLHSGGVKFWYELERPERALDDAFAGYVQTLREKSGYQVLVGTP